MTTFTLDEWNNYFSKKHTTVSKPCDFFLKEIKLVPSNTIGTILKCLDIGIGIGLEAYYMLQQNHIVHALDPYVPISYLEPHQQFPNFRFLCGTITDINIQNSLDTDYDVIIAITSLPFVSSKVEDVIVVMDDIYNRLKPGGLFIGSFLGDNHEWNGVREALYLPLSKVKELFDKFTINDTFTLRTMYDGGNGLTDIEIHYISAFKN